MFRRYTISIEVNNAIAEHLNGMEKELGCSISEPSNWVEYGSTRERGLTFLDKAGHELASPVFVHQPYFTVAGNKAESEIDAIKNLILTALSKHHSVTPSDINVKVTEFNRL